MRRFGVGIAVVVAAVFAAGAQGALLVTEFVADPRGTDADKEWIEIYNSGTVAIDLTGYKVGDEETKGGDEGMFSFPAGTTMAPGQVFVIALKASGTSSFFSTYNKLPDFEIIETDGTVPNMVKYATWGTGTIALANTGDHALIVGPDDTIVDGTNHGTANMFFQGATLGAYQSYERYPANVDTDLAADWRVNDEATHNPGVVYIPEPSALAGLGLLAALFARRRGA